MSAGSPNTKGCPQLTEEELAAFDRSRGRWYGLWHLLLEWVIIGLSVWGAERFDRLWVTLLALA